MKTAHRIELLRLARMVEALSWDSAAVVILNENNEALILQRGHTAPWMPNKWNLPGGTPEEGESSKQVALRETKEEVALTPSHMKFVGAVRGEDYVLHLYMARGYSGTLHLDTSENSDYAWVSVDGLDNYHFIPGLKDAIRAAMLLA